MTHHLVSNPETYASKRKKDNAEICDEKIAKRSIKYSICTLNREINVLISY
jgi:hypothetical protein